jgi:DNA primase
MAISRDTVAAVKQQTDIVQIIGEKVSLSPSGASFKGLCPFHSEKTPSFTVNPQRGIFHCFGCNAGGSAIDFVMAYDRIPFPEAVVQLARRAGIEVESSRGAQPGGKAQDVLEAAKEFYHENLMRRPEGEAARIYLRERGFEENAWQTFSMGFAMDDWRALVNHATSSGFSLADQLAAGLVKQGPSGRPYDLLRKRVAFPIRDVRGSSIAFGGRAIGDADSPKYLNTPETRFYQKSRVLFGLAESEAAMRRHRRAILVEGYLDVIRLHMAGVSGAVATCGTALTADHLALLERYADQVVMVFDGDEAGIRAALRSAPLFLNRGIEARVVTLPDGQDPDDFVLKQGGDAFAAELQGAVPMLEYLVWNTLRKNGETPAGKERAIQELMPLVGAVRSDAARDVTVRYMADLLGVRAEHLSRMSRPAPARDAGGGETVSGFDLVGRETRHQRVFLQILLRERSLLGKARELLQPAELSDPEASRLYKTILGMGDEAFQQTDAEELATLNPEVAGMLRSLIVETPLGVRAMVQCNSDLQYEIALIKEALKTHLFRKLKQVTGSAEEELALRRYMKVRDELRAMKSVPGARSLVADASPPPPEQAV